MNVAEQFVRSLEAEGVRYVFGVPGEENEDMLFALKESNIEFITCRHEQGAAFMADVWGRVTGRAGVCLATLGPGATNLLTGLSDAQLDKSPVVAITGQASSTRLHQESHQAIDVLGIFKPITKWNTSLMNPVVVPEAVRKAFKLAQAEKPGVTHLELPEDVASFEAVGASLVPSVVRRPAPDHKALEAAYQLLRVAKRPVVLAGNGAIRKLSAKHLRTLVEQLNLPVVTTFMGKGAVSDRDARALGSVGIRGRDIPLCALEAADLVITVGYDVAEYDPALWNTNLSRPLVHIDFTPAEVYASYQPQVEVVADISATLWALQQRVTVDGLKPYQPWFAPVRQALEADRAAYARDEGEKLTVPGVLMALRQALQDSDIVISDVGAHKFWVGRSFPVYEPGTCLISNGFASMGIAVPGGIAAKLAQPSARVVSVVGDGGFLMNAAELATAAKYKVPYTVLVLNDQSYGLIAWKQQRARGGTFATELINPDFVKLAESYGASTYHPRTTAEVQAALTAAVGGSTLAVVVVDVDPSVNLALSAKLDSDLCPNLAL